MKITRVGGRISRDRLPPGGQPVHGWLASCPGGKINWDTGSPLRKVGINGVLKLMVLWRNHGSNVRYYPYLNLCV